MPGFYMGTEGLNLDLHAYTASTLSTEPFLSPTDNVLMAYFYFIC